MSKSDWSLSDWFHCNSCYKQFSPKGDDPRNKFLFTSCGHIYCAECVDPGTNGTRPCKQCGSKFKTMILSKNIRPDIQQYFQDPKQMIKKGLDILKFQASHQKRLVNYRMSNAGRGSAANAIANKNNNNNSNNDADRKVSVLQDEVAYLKRLLAEKGYGQQRPSQRSPANTAHVSPRQHLAGQFPYPPGSGPHSSGAHPGGPHSSGAHPGGPHSSGAHPGGAHTSGGPSPVSGSALLSGSVRYHQHPGPQQGQAGFSGYRKSPYPQPLQPLQNRPQPGTPEGHPESEFRRPPGRLTITTPPFDAKRGCIVPSPGQENRRGGPQPMEVQSTPRQSPDSRPRPGYLSVAHPLPSFSPAPSPARTSPVPQPGISSASRPSVTISNVLPFTPGVTREGLSRYKANVSAANAQR